MPIGPLHPTHDLECETGESFHMVDARSGFVSQAFILATRFRVKRDFILWVN